MESHQTEQQQRKIEITTLENVQLQRMLQNSQSYMGDGALTPEQLEAYHQNYFGHEQEYEATRQKLRDMMLIDQEAVALDHVYHKLVEEADAERTRLETQASVSGMEKVKTDFFASKRRAAQRKLAWIDESKKALAQRKTTQGQQYRNSVKDKLAEAGGAWEQAVATAETEYLSTTTEANRIRQIPVAQRTAKERRFLKSYDQRNDIVADRILINAACRDTELTLRGNTDEFAQDEATGKKFSQNCIYRDTARWASPLGQAHLMTKEQLYDKACAAYIVETGRTIDQGTVTPQQGLQAMDTCMSAVARCYTEMTDFVQEQPALFAGSVSPEILLQNLVKVNDLYKKSQPIAYLTHVMLQSPFFAQLPNNQQEDLKMLRRYTSAMSSYTNLLTQQAKKWAWYAKRGETGDPEAAELDDLPPVLESFAYFMQHATLADSKKRSVDR